MALSKLCIRARGRFRLLPPACASPGWPPTTARFSSTQDPAARIFLRVPVTVKILKIEYLDGSTLIGLFEGFVQVKSPALTEVLDPPWVTQPPCNLPAPDEDGIFGALLDEFGTHAAAQALPPRALPRSGRLVTPGPLPVKVALDNLPPVGMQGTIGHLGSPGSCISWSFGYGLGSYTVARNPDGTHRWNPREPRSQVSPAFLYAFVHSEEGKLCPTGSSEGYLAQLVGVGAPSMEQVPYAPDCCYINAIDVDHQFPREDRFRIGSFAKVSVPASSDVDSNATLTRLKEFLAAGMAVAFAGPVFTNFTELPLDQGVFYPTGWCESTPEKPCGHGMLLVGYDDTLGDPDQGLGAFLVQNSFGTNWPAGGAAPAPPGKFYLSYSGFLQSQLSAQVAYPLDHSHQSGPPLASSPGGGPRTYIASAYQWADGAASGETPAYLILLHQFTEPVELESVTLAEPAPSTARATQLNGYPLSNGYTYLVRQDGKSWLSGEYVLTIVAKNASGQAFTYTGTVNIFPAEPPSPVLPPATMPDQVLGTTGQAAQVQH
jgi:hypothetical protein